MVGKHRIGRVTGKHRIRLTPGKHRIRLTGQKVLIGGGGSSQPVHRLDNVRIEMFLQIWNQFQPDPVPHIDRLLVGMIPSRRQPPLFAVCLDFFTAYIQQRPDDGEATFVISFIGDSCQSIRPAAPQKPEEDGFALILCVLGHGDGNLLPRHRSCGDVFRSLAEGFVAHLPAGFLRGQSRLPGDGRAVTDKGSARPSCSFTELLHKILVLFCRAGPELMVHMNRVQLQIPLPGHTAKHVKHAQRIGPA